MLGWLRQLSGTRLELLGFRLKLSLVRCACFACLPIYYYLEDYYCDSTLVEYAFTGLYMSVAPLTE